MITQCLEAARDLKDTVRHRRRDLDDAEHQLLESARRMAAAEESS
jgi:hypothetical protein